MPGHRPGRWMRLVRRHRAGSRAPNALAPSPASAHRSAPARRTPCRHGRGWPAGLPIQRDKQPSRPRSSSRPWRERRAPARGRRRRGTAPERPARRSRSVCRPARAGRDGAQLSRSRHCLSASNRLRETSLPRPDRATVPAPPRTSTTTSTSRRSGLAAPAPPTAAPDRARACGHGVGAPMPCRPPRQAPPPRSRPAHCGRRPLRPRRTCRTTGRRR